MVAEVRTDGKYRVFKNYNEYRGTATKSLRPPNKKNYAVCIFMSIFKWIDLTQIHSNKQKRDEKLSVQPLGRFLCLNKSVSRRNKVTHIINYLLWSFDSLELRKTHVERESPGTSEGLPTAFKR